MKSVLFFAALVLASVQFAVAQTETIKLWPGTAPGDEGAEIGPEKAPEPRPNAKRVVARLTNVTEPRIGNKRIHLSSRLPDRRDSRSARASSCTLAGI